MTSAERLAAIYSELAARGLPCLVMGGHAVRYYGVDRNTIDYDFHVALAPDEWRELPKRLTGAAPFAVLREGASWRPGDFRRFVIGTLPDGRDECLECWRHNHLLAPFAELEARREVGSYGGGQVAFLGLADLIRSKETERESDWQDVALLDEIADLRGIAAASTPEARKLLEGVLRTVVSGSARHLALVEAVRRLHKRAAMEADRADKEAAQRP